MRGSMESMYKGKLYEVTNPCSPLRLRGLNSTNSFYVLACSITARNASIISTSFDWPAKIATAGLISSTTSGLLSSLWEWISLFVVRQWRPPHWDYALVLIVNCNDKWSAWPVLSAIHNHKPRVWMPGPVVDENCGKPIFSVHIWVAKALTALARYRLFFFTLLGLLECLPCGNKSSKSSKEW